MSDDLERRLQEAFRGGSLPPAPARLSDTLQQVPDAPVRSWRRMDGRSVFGLLAISVGSAPRPAPTTPRPTPAASVAVAPPIGTLHVEYAALPVGGAKPTAADMATIVSILEKRIAATGVAGATVRVQGTDQVIVELPGVT